MRLPSPEPGSSHDHDHGQHQMQSMYAIESFMASDQKWRVYAGAVSKQATGRATPLPFIVPRELPFSAVCCCTMHYRPHRPPALML